MKEVEIQGTAYKIGKLNAFAQMYVLKRAAPVLGKLQSIFESAGGDDANLADVLEPLCAVIGELPDENLEYVCNAALDVVSMQQPGGGWARMRVNGNLMFPDLDLLTLLSLTVHTISANLSGFFRALPAFAQAPGQETKTT